jgi:hypothetical protein
LHAGLPEERIVALVKDVRGEVRSTRRARPETARNGQKRLGMTAHVCGWA